MSNPEDTQTTEASQESQDSQKSSRNKETTRSTADCLQWAIGEGIGDHLSLTDSQGESQNGRLNCNLCAVWLSTKGAILKDHVLGKNVTLNQQLEACRSMPQRAKIFLGTVGACLPVRKL